MTALNFKKPHPSPLPEGEGWGEGVGNYGAVAARAAPTF